MAKGRASLAEQLAELGDVAPKDYDYEEEADDFDATRRRNGIEGGGSDGSEGEEDAARSHALHNLVSLGASEMRRKANFIEGVDEDTRRRYQGVKATRKEMLSSDDEDGESEEEHSFESDEEMDDTEADEGTESDDEKSIDDASDDTGSNDVPRSPALKKTLRFADADDTHDARENTADGVGNAAQSDANLMSELRQRSRAEAQRGRDAKRQMDAWGRILGSRIRAQKVVRGATRIPTEVMNKHVASCTSTERESYDQLLITFDQLSAFLFQLQDRVLRSYASTSDDDTAGVQKSLRSLEERLSSSKKLSSKRKLDDDEFDEHLETAFTLHDRVHAPLWRSVLAKWSWRTSTNAMDDMKKSKNSFDSGNVTSNGLKAVNQSAQDQIERGLRGDAYDRLRKRTRTWRGNENETRVGPSDTSTDVDEGTIEDIDIFDDSDFYSALLRELIDSKGAGGDSGDNGQLSGAWAQAANRAAKKHRDVDRKASKGRRLRYDVHEKVQNFMPPIPAETWTAEQIARLMQQIRSGGLAHADEDKEGETGAPVELGGLRLFG